MLLQGGEKVKINPNAVPKIRLGQPFVVIDDDTSTVTYHSVEKDQNGEIVFKQHQPK